MAAQDRTLRFKFNPAQDGISKVLGPLEAQIMVIVWQIERATAADVHHELQLARQAENRNIAYTTVMTTMSRLYEKNILKRRKVGMSFLYTPVLDQPAFIQHIVKNVIDSLVNDYSDPVFHYFVEYVAQDEDRQRQLRRALGSDNVVPAPPVGS